LVYLTSTATQGTYDPITGLWTIGNLAVGQSVTLHINVMINGAGNIINTASVTVDQPNVGNSTASSSTNLTVKGNVNLTITKYNNVTGEIKVGDLILYTIVVTNHGPDSATGLRIFDLLDSRLIFVSSDGTQGTYNPVTGLWTIGNLGVGQSVTLYITACVNGSGNIVNIARAIVDQNNIGDNSGSDGVGFNAVEKPPLGTDLSISAEISDDGKTIFITAKLVDEEGNPISGMMVEFYIDYPDGSSEYVGSALTDENGIAKLQYTSNDPFVQGQYLIRGVFPDTDGYLPSSDTFVLGISAADDNDNDLEVVLPGDDGEYDDDIETTSDANYAYGVSMKETGLPILAIILMILLLLLLLGGAVFKKRRRD